MKALTTVLDDVLEKLAHGTGSGSDASAKAAESALRLGWSRIVGRELARVTTPLRFDATSRLLEVAVEARWREALFASRGVITERARHIVAALAGVRLVTVPEGHVPRPVPASPLGSAPEALAEPARDPRTAGLHDPDLRRSVDALIAAVERVRPGAP
jgi:hypothetical protein